MLLDARSVTALRTGAVAAVAAEALARQGARTVGIIGCGLHGAWAARCLAAAGYGPGVCYDPRPEAAHALARELDWDSGPRELALRSDVVCCVTPGSEIVVDVERPAARAAPQHARCRRSRQGRGVDRARWRTCALFCDEWEQASHGGELTGAIDAGLVAREQVTELGAVLAGDAPGRRGPEAVTLFDSTGLAIQDLAVAVGRARGVARGARRGRDGQL